jgi:hypothetical protein
MPETKVLARLLAVLAEPIAWLKAEKVAGVAELRLALKLQAEGVKKSPGTSGIFLKRRSNRLE